MLVGDNQQEMTSWFAGILEAEGSAYKSGCGTHYIKITNTESDLIGLCVKFLTGLSFTPVLTERKKEPRRKQAYDVRVYGANECYSLIKTLGNAFQCRYEEFMTKLELRSSTTTRDITLNPNLHWLIGAFEGEGCFSISHESGRYRSFVGMTNTKEVIIEKFVKTLLTLGCSWYSTTYKSEKAEHKKVFRADIRGMAKSLKFLRKARDFFVLRSMLSGPIYSCNSVRVGY